MRCRHCGNRISDTVAAGTSVCPVCKNELAPAKGDASAPPDTPPAKDASGEPVAAPTRRRPRLAGATAKFEHDDDGLAVAVSPADVKPAKPAADVKPAQPPAGVPAKDASAKGPPKFGPFEVKRKIGEGGMGAVFEGYDPRLDRRVAIKVLASRLAQNEEFVQRFLAEARAIARVAHPNVASVFFAGSEGNDHFFVMEFIEGESLDDLVERQGRLTPKAAIGFIIQTVKGLAAANERGIVHRDVKPANLMLSSTGELKVTDFGLAKASGEDLKLTQAGAVMGSPHFMAPEQGRGEETDFRADVYSLGATFYFLLTGEPPYDGDSSLAVILKHQEAAVPKIERAPPSLNRIVGKMMAKVPSGRYPKYDALMTDLERLDRSGLLRDELLRTTSTSDILVTGPGAVEITGPTPAGKTPLATRRRPGAHGTTLPTQKAEDEAVLLSQLDAVMKKRPGASGTLRRKRTSTKVPIRGGPPPVVHDAPDVEAEGTGEVPEGFEGYKLSPAALYGAIGGGVFLLLVVLSLRPWSWFAGGPGSESGDDPNVLETVEKLRPLLNGKSPGARQAAIRRIGRLRGETPARLLVSALLTDKAPEVRLEALKALEEFSGDRVVRAVHRALADPSADVRAASADCLENISGYAFPATMDWRTSPEALRKAEADDFMAWWHEKASP